MPIPLAELRRSGSHGRGRRQSQIALVTFNLRDFPRSELSKYDIEPLHPGEFIHHQLGLNLAAVIRAAKSCRARLRNPPKTARDYLDTLRHQGLPKTATALEEYGDLI